MFVMISSEKSKRKRIIAKLTAAANKAVAKSKGRIKKMKQATQRTPKTTPNEIGLHADFHPSFD